MSADIDILIRARDLASRTVRGVRGELGKLDKVGSKAARNLTTNMVRIGAVGAVGLAAGVATGVRGLGRLERLENQTAAVIESTGAAAGQTTQAIIDHADALERLTTAEAEGIQEGQNMLLTFTQIGKDVFPDATKATVNLAIAMAKGDVANADFKGSALQVGKALNDPIRGISALRRAGIQFTKAQEKQIKTLVESGDVLGAQKVILKELETQFGKAGEAAGTGFEADLRRIEHAGGAATEALARGLMPVLSRAATWLSRKLADPAVIAAVTDLGDELGAMAGKALEFVESLDFRAIGAGLKTAKEAAGAIVGAFLSLPPWVQQAVITGWGLNKLTGGALGDVVGALSSGLIKGVLGMNAGVVNAKAGVVNVMGGPGVPGAKGGGLGTVAKGAAGLGLAGGGAIAIAAIAPIALANLAIAIGKATGADTRQTQGQARTAAARVGRDVGPAQFAGHGHGLARVLGSAVKPEMQALQSMAARTKDDTVAAQNRTRDATLETKRETTRGLSLTQTATRQSAVAIVAAERNSAAAIVAAIRSTRPIVNVSTSVTAAAIRSRETYRARAGKANGSYGGRTVR